MGGLYISNFHCPRTLLERIATPTFVIIVTSTGNGYMCSHFLFAYCFFFQNLIQFIMWKLHALSFSEKNFLVLNNRALKVRGKIFGLFEMGKTGPSRCNKYDQLFSLSFLF